MRGTGNISGAGTKTIYNLNIGDATAATTTLTGTLTVSNDVTVDTGDTFNVNADLNINGGDFTTTTTGVVNRTSGTGNVTIQELEIWGLELVVVLLFMTLLLAEPSHLRDLSIRIMM